MIYVPLSRLKWVTWLLWGFSVFWSDPRLFCKWPGLGIQNNTERCSTPIELLSWCSVEFRIGVHMSWTTENETHTIKDEHFQNPGSWERNSGVASWECLSTSKLCLWNEGTHWLQACGIRLLLLKHHLLNTFIGRREPPFKNKFGSSPEYSIS